MYLRNLPVWRRAARRQFGRVSWAKSRFVGYSGLSVFGDGEESTVRGKWILQKEKEGCCRMGILSQPRDGVGSLDTEPSGGGVG